MTCLSLKTEPVGEEYPVATALGTDLMARVARVSALTSYQRGNTVITKPKPGSGLRFCDYRAAAPRSFNNTTVASDRESQIASLTRV